MRWLTLFGQLLGATGAVCTVLYPFERLKDLVGEMRDGAMVHEYPPGGPPLWKQLRMQPLQLKGGLWLIVVGFALQAVGTLVGL